MITAQQYLDQHAAGHESEITEELKLRASITCERGSALCARAGLSGSLRSGWRPAAYNAGVPGAAPASTHMSGEGIDIADDDGALRRFAIANLDVLEALGLWMEDPRATPSWLHVQTRAPRSGARVFIPDANWAARLAHAPKFA